MKAGPIEVGRLLQNRQRFCVPIYQRHYVWSRQKQWEPFWNDVRTKAIESSSVVARLLAPNAERAVAEWLAGEAPPSVGQIMGKMTPDESTIQIGR